MKQFRDLLCRWIIVFIPLSGIAFSLTSVGFFMLLAFGMDTSTMSPEKNLWGNVALMLSLIPPIFFGCLGSFLFLKWTKNIQSKFRKIFAFFWTPILIFHIYLIGGQIISFFLYRSDRFIFLLAVFLIIAIVVLVVKKYRER